VVYPRLFQEFNIEENKATQSFHEDLKGDAAPGVNRPSV
jgi:hypothetical protein